MNTGPIRTLATVALVACATLLLTTAVRAGDGHGDPYPLATCPVSGAELGSKGKPISIEHAGRQIKLCSKDCVAKFEKEPERYLREIDAAIIAQQKPFFPEGACVVSGDALGGDMGPPIDHVHGNRLVRLCCKGCVKDLRKDPAKYTAKLDERIIEQQKKTYPVKTCVVSGDELGSMGEPYDVVVANRLVRLCCKGCVKKVLADPPAYLAKLGDGHGKHDHGDHDHGKKKNDGKKKGHGDGHDHDHDH